jgi:hypothetical protein
MNCQHTYTCVQDVQMCNDDAALRAYLTKYLSKHSDSFLEDCMNDDGEGDLVAASVLSRYKPFEPEMVLQMFGGRFKQWQVNTISGGKRDFFVPVPDLEPAAQPKEVHLYVACTWKGLHMPMLEFLRKSTNDGSIHAWLIKKYDLAVLKHAYGLFSAASGNQPKEVKFVNFATEVRRLQKQNKADTPTVTLWDAAVHYIWNSVHPDDMVEQQDLPACFKNI